MGSAMIRPTTVVVAALIVREGRLLIGQRPVGKKRAGEWEFPGGKAEPGETPEQALRRELQEELGVEATVGTAFESVAHEYPDLSVVVHFLRCRLAPDAAVERREHDAIVWAAPDELAAYRFVEADRELLPRIAEALRAGRL